MPHQLWPLTKPIDKGESNKTTRSLTMLTKKGSMTLAVKTNEIEILLIVAWSAFHFLAEIWVCQCAHQQVTSEQLWPHFCSTDWLVSGRSCLSFFMVNFSLYLSPCSSNTLLPMEDIFFRLMVKGASLFFQVRCQCCTVDWWWDCLRRMESRCQRP